MKLIDVIKMKEKSLESTKKILGKAKLVAANMNDNDNIGDFIIDAGRLILQPTSFRQLTECRKLLRKTFGKWKDKKERQFWHGNQMIVIYEGFFEKIGIWLHLTEDEFREKFVTEKCILEEKIVEEKVLVYSCKV